MDKFLIRGGAVLDGAVTVSGSKNSSLPILAATLLTREPCVIRRVPDLSDTNYMTQILTQLGASVERASGTVEVRAEAVRHVAPYELVRKMRASICVLGPLYGRLGKCTISVPGGCVIGDRPIDIHLRGLQELGASIETKGGDMHVRRGRARSAGGSAGGREINMRGKHGPTVLGTDNLMMAAVLTKGMTVIEGAAAEPEVEDLAQFLIKMGAKIEGAGTRRIVIHGVKELHGAEHTVIPDRVEAGTFLVAGALAGRKVTLKKANHQHLASVVGKLRESGFEVEAGAREITIHGRERWKGGTLTTEPYPGFPTDMQAQFCALYALADGVSAVTETIFPERFMHLPELKRMGAAIAREGATAIITGVPALSAAPVMASDLRASAALVLAALRAEGETEINRVYHIDRGYEHIDEKLTLLGAAIERVQV
ncbi:MAG: UDP-N-acetylglucosamine 1-carboxyvinyltransferase [Verrucomicrobiales bacterium]